MNHGALTPIVLSDSRSDKARISHEIIDATRAGMVPHPKVMCGQGKNRANGKLHAPPVFRIHVPYVSHRRVAIADVASLWRRDHSLRGPRFGADHQIIFAEIKLLQG